jgi:RsiW-degrading membrane proteinase PrsW (M82 family)
MARESIRPSILSATGALLVGLGVYTAAIYLLAPWIVDSLGGNALVAAQVAIAVVPGVLWLAFFYSQDRLEPEPRHYVLGVFLLGAALAHWVALPLVRDLFAVDAWLYRSRWGHLLGAILVVGVAQEFAKYAAVRYTVYGSKEFDEPIDGVIYASAAGLGLATMLNVDYVLGNGGVDLRVGVLRMVVTALAHASFAGVLGYAMGRAKFREGTDTISLIGGIALAAAFNGVFFFLQGQVTTRGLEYKPWNGLILAAVFAVAVFAIVFHLMGRARAAGAHALAMEAKRHYLREDGPVLAITLVLLLAGFGVRGTLLHAVRPVSSADAAISVEVPADWFAGATGESGIEASDPTSGSSFSTRVSILRERGAGNGDPSAVAMGGIVRLSRELAFFRQLSSSDVTVSGLPAIRIDYVFVTDPHESILLADPVPVVVRAVEYLIPQGTDLVRVRLLADNIVYPREAKRLQRVVESIRLESGRS